MKDIVVVTPFSSMSEVTRRVMAENGYANVALVEAEPGNVLERVRRAIDLGGKVIVARGGFYELIRTEFDVPIVEIKVTAFDLIDAFKEARKHGGSSVVGVVGFHNVVDGAETIAEVMGIDAVCHKLSGHSDNIAEVERLVGQGIRVFVGDNNVKIAAKSSDCQAFIVHSGYRAMQMAIQQAEEILHASRVQKASAQQIATIIDFVHDGIIAVDKLGRITVFNAASEKITGFNQKAALGRHVAEIIPQTRLLEALTTKQPIAGDIQVLDNRTVVTVNRSPVIVDDEVLGAVATYQDITDVQRIEQTIRIKLAEKGFVAQYHFPDILHRSEAMAECVRAAQKFAQYDASVLITGPSGVGKELFAQSIHNHSRRKNAPFVAINCAALPETLIESELFGYVEGSFTGATRKGKAGLFEMAHGGTIFLDEISELPLLLQGRLLRVLQERQVMRLGGDKLIPVDVRIICATNRDLRARVEDSEFRDDLYFRIAILSLYVPPLRERSEDVELLSRCFLKELADRYGKASLTLGEAALDYLRQYDFKGNVRELRGMIERAVVVCESETIGVSDLDGVFGAKPSAGQFNQSNQDGRSTPVQGYAEDMTLRALEAEHIRRVLRKHGGSIKASSKVLGVGRTTLWRKIREQRLDDGDSQQMMEET